jgi:hypothetical protein
LMTTYFAQRPTTGHLSTRGDDRAKAGAAVAEMRMKMKVSRRIPAAALVRPATVTPWFGRRARRAEVWRWLVLGCRTGAARRTFRSASRSLVLLDKGVGPWRGYLRAPCTPRRISVARKGYERLHFRNQPHGRYNRAGRAGSQVRRGLIWSKSVLADPSGGSMEAADPGRGGLTSTPVRRMVRAAEGAPVAGA